jgi:hypothetical protein
MPSLIQPATQATHHPNPPQTTHASAGDHPLPLRPLPSHAVYPQPQLHYQYNSDARTSEELTESGIIPVTLVVIELGLLLGAYAQPKWGEPLTSRHQRPCNGPYHGC